VAAVGGRSRDGVHADSEIGDGERRTGAEAAGDARRPVDRQRLVLEVGGVCLEADARARRVDCAVRRGADGERGMRVDAYGDVLARTLVAAVLDRGGDGVRARAERVDGEAATRAER